MQTAPPQSVLKVTTAGGEFAEDFWSAVTLAKYPTGARTLRNFYITKRGTIANRPGLQYIAKSKINGKTDRKIPFEFSASQSFMLEFGYQYIRFFTNGLPVLVSGVAAYDAGTAYVVGDLVVDGGINYYSILAGTGHTPASSPTYWYALTNNIYEIPTAYLDTEVMDLRYAQSADILFIGHPDHKPMMLERFGTTNWQLVAFPFVGGPFMIGNTDTANTITPSAVTGTITITAIKDTFNALHVGALWQISHEIQGQTSSLSLGATGAQASIACGGTWRLISHGTWTGKFNVEKSTDGGSTWKVVRQFASTNDNNVNTYGQEINPTGLQFLVRINVTAYTSGTINVDLTTDAFTQVGVVKIIADAGNTTKAVKAIVQTTLGATAATWEWAEGSWSDYRGWPGEVVFNQDRLVWANTYKEPTTYWMSQSSNYYDYSTSDPLQDTDAISSPLPARKLNEINALVPLKGLVGLTSSGEWGIGDPLSILTQKTIINSPNSYYGAYPVQPVVVGLNCVYVQSSGQAVRDLTYQYFYNYFNGADISIFSYHLLKNYSIVEMAYALDPDSIIWMVRSDGQLLSLTYLKEQDIIAWAHHDTPFGLFESVAVIQGEGYKEVWFTVNRGGQRYTERFTQRGISTDPADQKFLDCSIEYSGQSQKIMTGLGHLEGFGVGVLAEGSVIYNYDNPVTVVGGEITLDAPYTKAQIGIPYLSDLETLDFEIPTPSGTAVGKRGMISKVSFRLLNSRGGKIGSDFTKMFPFSSPAPTQYNTPLPLVSGLVPESLYGGYQDGARLCVRQSDPLPMELLAVVPVVKIGGVSTLT